MFKSEISKVLWHDFEDEEIHRVFDSAMTMAYGAPSSLTSSRGTILDLNKEQQVRGALTGAGRSGMADRE